jgi:hypothetical protein
MTYTLTAADYVYLDRTESLYRDTKTFIDSHRHHPASDSHDRRRPGIPGTLKVLNLRVQTLVELGKHDTAARLIARKVAKAYRLTP